MRIDIWSDVVCPWCYIGKRRFERALAEFEHRSQVEVRWHSFELDPDAVPSNEQSVDRLARKYGMTREAAQASSDRVSASAAAEGLDFDLANAKHGNSFDAHRVIHLAADQGLQDAMKERLLRGYFTQGADIADHEILTALAVQVGLDEAQVRGVLAGNSYADAVRADEQQARSYGITGVPFFVLDGKYAVSGAQPSEQFSQALEQAWPKAQQPQLIDALAASGESCDDGSCPV